jgi:hypothetical protein
MQEDLPAVKQELQTCHSPPFSQGKKGKVFPVHDMEGIGGSTAPQTANFGNI